MGRYAATGTLAVVTIVAFCLKLLFDPFPTIIVAALGVIAAIAWIFEGPLDCHSRDRKMQQRETAARARGLPPRRAWEQNKRGAVVDTLRLRHIEPGIPGMSEHHHLVHDLSGIPTGLLGQPFTEPPEDRRDDPANWGRGDT